MHYQHRGCLRFFEVLSRMSWTTLHSFVKMWHSSFPWPYLGLPLSRLSWDKRQSQRDWSHCVPYGLFCHFIFFYIFHDMGSLLLTSPVSVFEMVISPLLTSSWNCCHREPMLHVAVHFYKLSVARFPCSFLSKPTLFYNNDTQQRKLGHSWLGSSTWPTWLFLSM